MRTRKRPLPLWPWTSGLWLPAIVGLACQEKAGDFPATGGACSTNTCGGSGGSVGDGGGAGIGGSASSGGSPTAGGTAQVGAGGSEAPSGGAAAAVGGASVGGGAQTGGGGAVSSGGSGSGTGGARPLPEFILGADISSVEESSSSLVDTDGQTKSIHDLLKNHGFNFIRLRTFVDPLAPYGYASSENGCTGKSEAFGDAAHVVLQAAAAHAEDMGVLLDFHYSDVWADPAKQIVPESWRNVQSTAELAALTKDYTMDVLSAAVAAGARPDIVQVGNEITGGMLAHVPDSDTDCWGNGAAPFPLGGNSSNWNQLGTLLKAGIAGVREVDPSIPIMLHIENTEDLAGVKWWVDGALAAGVTFDILGLSCYTAFQGEPSVWENTFNELAKAYPDLKFVIAEYNPEPTRANEIIRDLPDGRGLGTFFWEPTLGGAWGDPLFTWEGDDAIASPAAFAPFDAFAASLGSNP